MYYKSEFLRNRFVMIRGRFSGGLPEAFFGIVFLDLFGTDVGMNFGFVFFGAFFGGLGPKGLGGNLSDFCCLGNEIEIDGFSGGYQIQRKCGGAAKSHTVLGFEHYKQ